MNEKSDRDREDIFRHPLNLKLNGTAVGNSNILQKQKRHPGSKNLKYRTSNIGRH